MSEESGSRVWMGLGWLRHISCHMSGRVGMVGYVPGMCVSVWQLLLATLAPYREGKIPMGMENKHAWLLRNRKWG